MPEGCTATDLVLTVTQILRKKGVVGKFVEFYGQGLSALSVADRATVANMAPEYGATIGFFPDRCRDARISALHQSRPEPDRAGRGVCQGAGPVPHGRDARSGLSRRRVDLDLATMVPSMAGPKRPQDRVNLADVKKNFNDAFGGAHKPVRSP